MSTNENCKQISTKDLIILCEIFEDYKAFYDDLEALIKSKTNKDLVDKVYHYILKTIRKEKIFFANKKYDAFIEKHKHTIEIIEKYGYISNYTSLIYTATGIRRSNRDEDYFYQYLEEHKEDIETIKKVALKIKELGIDRITFGEHLDFTAMEYTLNTSYDCSFAFLENMEVIPTYLSNPIRYRTSSSLYCIHLKFIYFYGSKDQISEIDRRIDLNSLIFDPDKLPNEITIESTIDVIKGLAEKKKEEYEDIRDSVNLSLSTSDLKNEFESLKKNYEKIDKLKDNQELKSLLNQMQNIIAQLQVFKESFEQEAIDTHEGISKDIIIKEKKAESDRRYWANIDPH